MEEEKVYAELTPREWQALTLVNEKIVLSPQQLAHLMYGSQSAVNRALSLLEALVYAGYVQALGRIGNFKYATTEAGEDYIENAPKPAKPFTCRS